MKRVIELKHVGPKPHVRQLIEELIDRLEDKLQHFPSDAVSIHVLFEENGSHKVFRTSLTCHIPGHTAAAHDEGREGGQTIHAAFEELERQLLKYNALLRGEHLRHRNEKMSSLSPSSDVEPV